MQLCSRVTSGSAQVSVLPCRRAQYDMLMLHHQYEYVRVRTNMTVQYVHVYLSLDRMYPTTLSIRSSPSSSLSKLAECVRVSGTDDERA